MKANKIFENEKILREWFFEEGEEITPEIESLLKEHKDSIEEFVSYMIPLIKETEGKLEAKKSYIKELTESKNRYEKVIERQKKICDTFMKMFDIDKIETPQGQLSYRKSTFINIIGEVPKEYCIVEYKPSKTVIKELITKGHNFEFAKLEETKKLQVKG